MKKKGLIISTVVMVVVLIASLTTATYAWFTAASGLVYRNLFCVTRYGWGWDNFIKEADTGNGIKFPKWARPYLTYVLPLIVLLIFVMGYYDKFFR